MKYNKCLQCAVEYRRRTPSRPQKYCSRSCYFIAKKGKPIKEARYSWGYRYLFLPDHPDSSKQGYIAEHRLFLSNSLGRSLLATEVVHHINGKKDDNRLENLVACTRSEHIAEHKDVVRKKKH